MKYSFFKFFLELKQVIQKQRINLGSYKQNTEIRELRNFTAAHNSIYLISSSETMKKGVNAFQNHINKRMKEYNMPFFCIFTPNIIQGMNIL